MLLLMRYFFRRLVREGLRSVTVPLLALVLVVLINLLGGVKAWLEEEYENTMSHFPVIARLSDTTGAATDGLYISEKYIDLFLDADAPVSLYRYTGELTLKRTMNIVDDTKQPTGLVLTGISNFGADDDLAPESGAVITFFGGFYEGVFSTDETVCVVSEDLLEAAGVAQADGTKSDDDQSNATQSAATQPDAAQRSIALTSDGKLRMNVRSISNPAGPGGIPASLYKVIDVNLTVAGTVSGSAGNRVYAPFWTVSALGIESDELPRHTERLFVKIADNRALSTFKQVASLSFPKVAPIYDSRPFSMMIYDSDFYATLEPLRQNIILIDVATPFLYVISVCVGFLASVLLTRRRKPEFALMRCAGIHRRDIFLGTLTEQVVLSTVGAALGCALVTVTWGYFSIVQPSIFLACYILGTVFSSISAAGTDVLKILQERE